MTKEWTTQLAKCRESFQQAFGYIKVSLMVKTVKPCILSDEIEWSCWFSCDLRLGIGG